MEKNGKKTTSPWRRPERILLLVLVAILAFLLIRNIGMTRKLDGTMEATVFTETGEVILCPVQVTGSYTHYPLKGDGADLIDSLSLWKDDRLIVEFEHITGQLGYAYSYRYTGVLRRDMPQVFVELDMKTIDPAREGIRCVVALPAVSGGKEAVSLLKEMELHEDAQSAFCWLWGE